MILDRMVVYQLHQRKPSSLPDPEMEISKAWVDEVASMLNPAARFRIWAGTALIKAGTALRAPALPDTLAVSSPCESD